MDKKIPNEVRNFLDADSLDIIAAAITSNISSSSNENEFIPNFARTPDSRAK